MVQKISIVLGVDLKFKRVCEYCKLLLFNMLSVNL